MSQITTHILDTSAGKPASGVSVLLEQQTAGGWKELGKGITDNDGRVKNLLPDNMKVDSGIYRLTFQVGAYFTASGKKTFYPNVKIEFEISDSSHYHVPLLLNPFGYSTYRGS